MKVSHEAARNSTESLRTDFRGCETSDAKQRVFEAAIAEIETRDNVIRKLRLENAQIRARLRAANVAAANAAWQRGGYMNG